MAKKKQKKNDRTGSLGFEAKLWEAADHLRSNMDPAEYKHVVLGLLFLKYISDAFEERREELSDEVAEPKSEYYIDNEEQRKAELAELLGDRDEFTAENIFWVPPEARWSSIQAQAKQPEIGKIVDDAMDTIERENPTLKGVLPKVFALPGLNKHNLGQLIDLVSGIGLGTKEDQDKDTLGRVYEYFLSRFASSEGKGGGEFFTPTSVVRLLVEMLEPYQGRVYDPCCGSGGMFVQSLRFTLAHNGSRDQVTIYGQESNRTTWRLARMNLAIRGIEANLGKKHADSFHEDLHPDLRADFILANPPFNVSVWGGERLPEDVRWEYGVPPASNANFAWVQHILHHLAPSGCAGFVLASGSLSSMQSAESKIRQSLVEADQLDCIVALPGQLFYATPIPVAIWFVTKNKARARQGEVLFIDARKCGHAESRTHRVLTEEDIDPVAAVYRAWKNNVAEYEDTPGFCRSVTVDEIADSNHDLLPARYVGLASGEDAVEPAYFLSAVSEDQSALAEQLEESEKLAQAIEEQLSRLLSESDVAASRRLDEATIGDLVSLSDERLGDSPEPEILTCTERAGLILQKERFSKRVATKNTSKYKVVRRTDIVYNPYLLWAGAIGQCWVVDLGITSPAYQVFRVREDLDPTLVGQLLTSRRMIQRYDGISVGTVHRRRRAPAEKFLELDVLFPRAEEQQTMTRVAGPIQKMRRLIRDLDQRLKSTLENLGGIWLGD